MYVRPAVAPVSSPPCPSTRFTNMSQTCAPQLKQAAELTPVKPQQLRKCVTTLYVPPPGFSRLLKSVFMAQNQCKTPRQERRINNLPVLVSANLSAQGLFQQPVRGLPSSLRRVREVFWQKLKCCETRTVARLAERFRNGRRPPPGLFQLRCFCSDCEFRE
jgi:hypothetical protein